MKDKLAPITLTRKISNIHAGGFSSEEEKVLGFAEGELFETPTELFHLVTLHKKNFAKNLNLYKEKILNNSNYKEIHSGVFAHSDARVDEQVVFNTEKGIIVLEKGTHINPFSYLVGPLRINENATINPHTNISNSYVGKYSKIGGDVSNSTIEAYSNKGHYGYLGDSYVGSWVNIGGGTSGSNLKNTYGTIKLDGVETGEQFIGSIIADHVKTAVNVSMYTGKVIGVSAHIYGTVTTDVPSFVNYISKDNMVLLPLELSVKIAGAMQKRRGIEISDDDKAMLSYAYSETEEDRKKCTVKEGKLSF